MHCCPHIETSQLIFIANQLTGFYMRAMQALNRLINTHSQKLGYIFSDVYWNFTFVYTLYCNFLGFTNTKININHKLLCHHNLTFFVGKIYPFLYFWRIDRTSSLVPFVGEISFDSSIPLVLLLCYYKWSQ